MRAQPRQRTSESGLESGDSEVAASARSPQPTLEGYGLKVLFEPVETVVAVVEYVTHFSCLLENVRQKRVLGSLP